MMMMKRYDPFYISDASPHVYETSDINVNTRSDNQTCILCVEALHAQYASTELLLT